jgi:hypothetical protein
MKTGVRFASALLGLLVAGYDGTLLFDRKYPPKPAFFAVQEALSAKPAEKVK